MKFIYACQGNYVLYADDMFWDECHQEVRVSSDENHERRVSSRLTCSNLMMLSSPVSSKLLPHLMHCMSTTDRAWGHVSVVLLLSTSFSNVLKLSCFCANAAVVTTPSWWLNVVSVCCKCHDERESPVLNEAKLFSKFSIFI